MKIKAPEDLSMNPQQVEEKVIELIHREPFIPFVVEMIDGQTLDIPHPQLAINGGGAVFLGPDGGLVDFEFNSVSRLLDIPTSAAQ
jgi:hypothetical protein